MWLRKASLIASGTGSASMLATMLAWSTTSWSRTSLPSAISSRLGVSVVSPEMTIEPWSESKR